jgi:hypothetical protein
MKIDLDTEYLKVSIDLWRKATDIEVEMAPAFVAISILVADPCLKAS